MAKNTQLVERNKASKGLRLGNYLIDLAIFYGCIMGVFFVMGLISQDPEALIDDLDHVNPFLDRILTLILYAIYMFVIEILLKGRSIGKFLTGTKVVTTDGNQPTMGDLFTRNISRAVPFDQLSFLGNNGWHDSWSDTRVVRIKEYETALKLEKEMEMLGSAENL